MTAPGDTIPAPDRSVDRTQQPGDLTALHTTAPATRPPFPAVLCDRGRAAPSHGEPSAAAGWRCLWSAGPLLNGETLARRHGFDAGLPRDETLAALFDTRGPAVLAEVEGPVAGLLWHGAERRLVAFRDRLGWHPVHFGEKGEEVAVAGAAPAVLAALGVAAEADRASLASFLAAGRAAPGASFYRGTAALEPGELIEVTPRRCERRTWWRLDPGPPIPERDAAEAVAEVLDRVVAETTAGPRPALTLSSGLDSGSVAAAMRRSTATRIVALTWSTPSLPAADETAPAAGVARHLGLEHVALPVDDLWPLSSPDGFATRPEGPFRSPYAEAWMATFRRAAELGVTHLSSGAGGDQLFGYCGPGFYAYPDLLLSGRWWQLGRQLRDHRRVSSASLVRIVDRELMRPFLRPLARPLLAALDPRRRPAPWLAAGERCAAGRSSSTPPPGGLLPGRRHRLRVLADRFQPVVLTAIGALAAEEGVDVRFPLVDRRLWELAARLPATATYRAGYHKAVLRDALAGRLPESCLGRRFKIHAAPLFDRGLRERSRAVVEPLLHGMRAADLGLVDELALRRVYRRYLEGEADSQFWYALTLEDWLRRYF